MWALIAKTTVQLSVSASVPSAIIDPPLFNIIVGFYFHLGIIFNDYNSILERHFFFVLIDS